ncbi:MAG TPA: hypothetical protein VIL83_09930 [Capillibacterium sp.]
MKKIVALFLCLTSALAYNIQASAGEAEDHLSLAEEIVNEYAGSNYAYEFALLPQAYLLLEEALIADPDDYNAQILMAEYLIKAPDFLGGHPKKAIKILENIPSFGNEELDARTACCLARAYYLDHQREKAISTLENFLSRYEKNEAARSELARIQPQEGKAFQLSLYPVLPFNGFVFGIGVTPRYKQFSTNISASYELSHKLFYYDLAAKYNFTPSAWTELSYFRGKNDLHPGYHYWDGFKTQFTYDNGLGGVFEVSFFDGEIGRGDKKKEPLSTKLASIAAENYLYDDWGKNLGYSLHATFGAVKNDGYQIYTLKLPFRYHNYQGLFSLGFINQSEEINMHFENQVRGYFSDGREGVNRVLLSLERRFSLFPSSQEPFLGALQGRIFADVGTVYNDGAGLKLQKSAGPGLLYNTPLFDLCVDLAFTEEGVKPVFQAISKEL